MIETFQTIDGAASGKKTVALIGEKIHVPRGVNIVTYGVLPVGSKEWERHRICFSDDANFVEDVNKAFPELAMFHQVRNSRTAAGASWEASLMGSAAGTPANYMAITTDSTAVANGDTSVASELATNGLSRVASTYTYTTAQASLGGTAVFTLAAQWTFTGASATVIAKAGLLNAASSGTLAFEAVLSPTITVNSSGDIAKVTWTITI